MRIGLLCGEYPPGVHGGIGTWTQLLARHLVAMGHDVRVLGVYPAKHSGKDYEIDRGVQVWRIRARRIRGGWPIDRATIFKILARWARNGDVDLIEVPDWQGWAAGWPLLPVPVVARLHGSESYFASEMGRRPRALTWWIERMSLQRADFWCSTSRYTAERTPSLFKLPRTCDAVLHNPVTCDVFPTETRSRADIVFSGTLTAKKGVVSLIEAWGEVRRQCPTAELHVFGKDGTSEAGGSMQAFLTERGGTAESGVHFHGHVDRTVVLERLRRCRLAVFPSWSEAFPLAPLEAMACGCPTIGSRRSSGPELIEDGATGLLVDPADPSTLASAIVAVLNDDGLAARLGAAGMTRVRTAFSADVLFERYAAFYRWCTSNFRATRRPAHRPEEDPAAIVGPGPGARLGVVAHRGGARDAVPHAGVGER